MFNERRRDFMYILAIILLAGIALRSAVVVSLAVPLMLFFLLSHLSLPDREDRINEENIRINRTLSTTRVGEGDEVQVTVEISFSPELLDSMKLAIFEVADSIPELSEVLKGSNMRVLSASALEKQGNGAAALTYSIRFAQRGVYEIGPLNIRIYDPFSTSVYRLKYSEKAVVTVMPEVEMIKSMRLNIKRTRSIVGDINSRKRGIGTEFYGIRDYYPGDELKHINWKASARTADRLLTNEYTAERSGDVTILIDARKDSILGPPGKSTIDYGIRAAASISWNVLNRKNRVGMIVFRDTIDVVQPGYGKRQFYRLMNSLLLIKDGGKMPFRVAAWALGRFFPMRSHIIVISAANDGETVSTVAELCSHGYDVLVISPSYVMIEADSMEDGPEKETAMAMEMMKRNSYLDELRGFTEVIDWDVRKPLSTYWAASRRGTGRR